VSEATVTKTVSKSEFKPRALAYLREVEVSGDALVITDRGRPVVRIEPYRPARETLERLRGCVVRYEEPTEPVAADDWEAAR
jgi:prevent-host-death family protein